jgi:hypothetical protein
LLVAISVILLFAIALDRRSNLQQAGTDIAVDTIGIRVDDHAVPDRADMPGNTLAFLCPGALDNSVDVFARQPADALLVRLQKPFVERHRMTQLVELNPRFGAARKMAQHTTTHFCFWKKPTMFLCHPHPLPYSKAVALLPRIERPPAHRNSGVVAFTFGNGHDHRSEGVMF